jgi:peptidyl-tRNA hydrolase, PTH1 family
VIIWDMSEICLIAGLGNPGANYACNRHNIGFQCVDRLAAKHGLTFSRMMHRARIATGLIAGRSTVLAKPLTFMNHSGRSVGPLVHWYKLPLDRLLVIYDDLDLPLGTIRIRPSGSAGGHKGVNSIIQVLGSQDFPRLRVGIGRPPSGWDPADYVLSDFASAEKPIVTHVYERVVQASECWLSDGLTEAMNRFNQST